MRQSSGKHSSRGRLSDGRRSSGNHSVQSVDTVESVGSNPMHDDDLSDQLESELEDMAVARESAKFEAAKMEPSDPVSTFLAEAARRSSNRISSRMSSGRASASSEPPVPGPGSRFASGRVSSSHEPAGLPPPLAGFSVFIGDLARRVSSRNSSANFDYASSDVDLPPDFADTFAVVKLEDVLSQLPLGVFHGRLILITGLMFMSDSMEVKSHIRLSLSLFSKLPKSPCTRT